MASQAQGVSRSAYVGQLRRAFLLRVHPDRFRSHGAAIQSQQAKLVVAIGERLNDLDFQSYVGNANPHSRQALMHNRGSASAQAAIDDFMYFLERRDGSLLTNQLRLSAASTPFEILTDIAKALKACGAAVSMPPPPSTIEEAASEFSPTHAGFGPNGASDPFRDFMEQHSRHRTRGVNTEKGRDIVHFLSNLDRDYIEQCKASRLAASTAALVARRMFSFQSIDGTRTGWSSESFCKILKSLIHLHDEHGDGLTQSFYPLRLVFTSDDMQGSYDLYGGEVLLHPGMTPNQWLPILKAITSNDIDVFRRNRQLLNDRQALLQQMLGIRISKGHSCSSLEFHRCLDKYASALVTMSAATTLPAPYQYTASTFLGVGKGKGNANIERTGMGVQRSFSNVHIVVESPQASRAPRVAKTGSIQINYQLDLERLIASIQRLEEAATAAAVKHQDSVARYKQLIKQAQWDLGIQTVRKVGHVDHEDCCRCLMRLLQRKDDMRGMLSGMSIKIASPGNFCSIGDDGSLLLPCDFA